MQDWARFKGEISAFKWCSALAGGRLLEVSAKMSSVIRTQSVKHNAPFQPSVSFREPQGSFKLTGWSRQQ